MPTVESLMRLVTTRLPAPRYEEDEIAGLNLILVGTNCNERNELENIAAGTGLISRSGEVAIGGCYLGYESVQTDRWKPIRMFDPDPVYRLFDLKTDPEEKFDMAARQPEVFEDMKKIFKMIRGQNEQLKKDYMIQEAGIDPELMKQSKTMGIREADAQRSACSLPSNSKVSGYAIAEQVPEPGRFMPLRIDSASDTFSS